MDRVRAGSDALAGGRCVVTSLNDILTVLSVMLLTKKLLLLQFVELSTGRGGRVTRTRREGELGAKLVHGLAVRLGPAVRRLSGRLPPMGTLADFVKRVRRLTRLRSALSRPCRLGSRGVTAFYRGRVSGVHPFMGPSIALAIGTPGVGITVRTRRLKQLVGRLLIGTVRRAPSNKGVALSFGGHDTRAVRFVMDSANYNVTRRGQRRLFGPFARVGSLVRNSNLKLPVYTLVTRGVGKALALSADCAGKAHFVIGLGT